MEEKGGRMRKERQKEGMENVSDKRKEKMVEEESGEETDKKEDL